MPTPAKKTPAKPAPKKIAPIVRDNARMMAGHPSGTKPTRPTPLTLRATPRESMFTTAQQSEICELVKRELAQLVAGLDTSAILSRFQRNLLATNAWYASRAERPEADVYVTVGVAITGVAFCLDLALAGKDWTPDMADAKKDEKVGGK